MACLNWSTNKKNCIFWDLYIFPVRIILRQGKLAKEGPWEGEILVLEKNV